MVDELNISQIKDSDLDGNTTCWVNEAKECWVNDQSYKIHCISSSKLGAFKSALHFDMQHSYNPSMQ